MIVVVDYGMGNLGSLLNMLRKIGAPARLSSVPDEIRNASKLILPGVGAFDAGMRSLAERGLIDVLQQKVMSGRTRVLGICLGMQLLARRSDEGTLPGLGWIDACVNKFPPSALRVPHMGWAPVHLNRAHPLFDGAESGAMYYFVHSYYVDCAAPDDVVGRSEYGETFVAAVARDNIAGVQFHPEKSLRYGRRILENFCRGGA